MSMLLLLPSAFQVLPILIVIISGLITILFIVWGIPKLVSGVRIVQQQTDAIDCLSIYIISAITLCLCFTYILGMDLTLAARFQFIYAPALILLLAAGLTGCWQINKKIALVINCMTFLG